VKITNDFINTYIFVRSIDAGYIDINNLFVPNVFLCVSKLKL